MESISGFDDAMLAKKWGPSRGVIVLGPEAYAMSLMPTPEGTGAFDSVRMKEALRWAYAKDSEIDMAHADVEILKVAGGDEGGALLKESYWLFAMERARVAETLSPWRRSSVRVEVIDTLATAQRNLEWAEIRGRYERAGGYASIVIGENYSALGIVSLDGDLLFHKQMEWTRHMLSSVEARERLVVDLQRNLTYFERRQSSFAVLQGHVFASDAQQIASHVTESLGTFDWAPATYPSTTWAHSAMGESMDGDFAWLLGALWRWA